MTEYEEFCNHELVKAVFEEFSRDFLGDPATLRKLQGNSQERDEARRQLSERHPYARRVFERLMHIGRAIEDMERAVHFSSSFPFDGKRQEISRQGWMNYHLAYFAIVSTSLVDYCLKLTATVYQLGLSDRHCTLEILKSHEVTSNSQVIRLIQDLDKILKPTRRLRNNHVHGARPAEIRNVAGIADDDVLMVLYTMEIAHPLGVRLGSKKLERDAWQVIHRNAADVLSTSLRGAWDGTNRVLSALRDPYVERGNHSRGSSRKKRTVTR